MTRDELIDAEHEIAEAIESSASIASSSVRIVSLAWVDAATDAARREALLVECDDSAEHEDGSSEWWGTTADEEQWRVHLAAECDPPGRPEAP